VPNLHLLRVWSSLSCLLVLIFSIITIAISCHDGASLAWPPQVNHSRVELCLLQAVACPLRIAFHDRSQLLLLQVNVP